VLGYLITFLCGFIGTGRTDIGNGGCARYSGGGNACTNYRRLLDEFPSLLFFTDYSSTG